MSWKHIRRAILFFAVLCITCSIWLVSLVQAYVSGFPHTHFTHEQIVEMFIESMEIGSASPLGKISNHPDCRDQVQADFDTYNLFAHSKKVINYAFSVRETNHEDEDLIHILVVTEDRKKSDFILFAKVRGFPPRQYLCGL